MDQPNKPADGKYSAARTASYQQAFRDFTEVKKTYTNKNGWSGKYAASQLGGKSCLRHYQLESYFADEYVQNKDFKDFVDQQPGNNDFVDKGFQSSRKGLNLQRRMERNCPDEAEKAKTKEASNIDDMRNTFMNLGKELGYFDEQGNMIKPIEIPEEEKKAAQNTASKPSNNKAEKDPKTLSRRKQVKKIKERVAALPSQQPTRDKVNNITQDLDKAKPRSNKLGKFLKGMIPIAAVFLAPQIPMLSNLGNIGKFLGGLLSWKPKIPRLGLWDKLKGLFNWGKKLKDKAQDVVDRSKNWKDKVDDLADRAQKVQDGIDDKIKDATDLNNDLNDLQKKKEDLMAKLEDKPKKILDQLWPQLEDVEERAQDAIDKANQVEKEKEDLLKQLDDLEKEKEELMAEKDALEKEVEQLKKDEADLQQQADEVGKEVEEVKQEEEELARKEDNLNNLPSDDELKEALKICEDDLKGLLFEIKPVRDVHDKLKGKFDQVKDKPKGLFDKIRNLKLFQEKLKVPDVDIPIADKTIKKVDGLLEKASLIGSISELLIGKKTNLQERIEDMDQKFDNIQDVYNNRTEKLEQLKGDLVDLIGERTGLKEKFAQAMTGVDDIEKAYDDFINRYNIFENDAKCVDQNELKEKLEDLKKEQAETEPELEKLEEEVEEVAQKEEALEEETKQVEEEIKEEKDQVQEIKQEEETIKEEFGEDVKLEPVKAEEWTESFEVEREYWDAVFHPDDEVVEGYKGRWFQVRLKDADHNVKLLFGPGEYYMDKSDFRDNYGSVIGAFVTEALNGMKKIDRESVKLFVQGSADITGQNTFRGKLSDKYKYEEVTVLPQTDNSENFSNQPSQRTISASNFTNDDLPNLRGRFLKEMISIYSKKLDPILLEGAVKQKENKEDRNAVIYLFIPEALVDKYGG
jgi:predicted  nucleic acid-binding Zn-ribbon protein